MDPEKAVAHRAVNWLADTGCTHIMSPHTEDVDNSKPRQVSINFADRSTIHSTHQGTAVLPFEVNQPPKALLVPSLEEPLLSISSVCDGECEVLFTSTDMQVYPSQTLSTRVEPLALGHRRNNLYYLPQNEVRASCCFVLASKANDLSLFDWHVRLGHVGLKPLKQVLKEQEISVSNLNEIDGLMRKTHAITNMSQVDTIKAEKYDMSLCSYMTFNRTFPKDEHQ